jgi:hypothetical protein
MTLVTQRRNLAYTPEPDPAGVASVRACGVGVGVGAARTRACRNCRCLGRACRGPVRDWWSLTVPSGGPPVRGGLSRGAQACGAATRAAPMGASAPRAARSPAAVPLPQLLPLPLQRSLPPVAQALPGLARRRSARPRRGRDGVVTHLARAWRRPGSLAFPALQASCAQFRTPAGLPQPRLGTPGTHLYSWSDF